MAKGLSTEQVKNGAHHVICHREGPLGLQHEGMTCLQLSESGLERQAARVEAEGSPRPA